MYNVYIQCISIRQNCLHDSKKKKLEIGRVLWVFSMQFIFDSTFFCVILGGIFILGQQMSRCLIYKRCAEAVTQHIHHCGKPELMRQTRQSIRSWLSWEEAIVQLENWVETHLRIKGSHARVIDRHIWLTDWQTDGWTNYLLNGNSTPDETPTWPWANWGRERKRSLRRED